MRWPASTIFVASTAGLALGSGSGHAFADGDDLDHGNEHFRDALAGDELELVVGRIEAVKRAGDTLEAGEDVEQEGVPIVGSGGIR